MNDEAFEQIDTGVDLIKRLLKNIRKPADANSKKELSESVDLLKKKSKLMKKDDSLAIQYLDKVKYDTIQGVFQSLHLYIISTDEDTMINEVIGWLRYYENCYDIAARMQKAALARADFSNGRK